MSKFYPLDNTLAMRDFAMDWAAWEKAIQRDEPVLCRKHFGQSISKSVVFSYTLLVYHDLSIRIIPL
jgi:hypothetical protein